jgi:hypothetical protein
VHVFHEGQTRRLDQHPPTTSKFGLLGNPPSAIAKIAKQLQRFLTRLPWRKAARPHATALCPGEQGCGAARLVAALGHDLPIRAATIAKSRHCIRKLASPFKFGQPRKLVAG